MEYFCWLDSVQVAAVLIAIQFAVIILKMKMKKGLADLLMN